MMSFLLFFATFYRHREGARLSPKSVPKAYKRSEVKTAELFRSAFASYQPLASCVGERGGGGKPFLRKNAIIACEMKVESWRNERVESLESLIFYFYGFASVGRCFTQTLRSAIASLAMTR